MEQTFANPDLSSATVMISVQNLVKFYQIEKHRVEALRNVSVDIKRGQIIAITGRSGSGKSTLLHIVGTLDSPTSGKIFINDTDVSKIPDQLISNFRNYTVGFVFQMNNLLPEFSALENVIMPGLIAGISRKEVSPRGYELLKSAGLENRTQHRPGELSGGEQQRVAIARALLMEPPILLADEPTGNLDKKNSESVRDLLLDLCYQRRITMLLVIHDQNLAGSLPTQIVMEDGQIVERGGSW